MLKEPKNSTMGAPRKKVNIVDPVIGKIPPQAVDIEELVIGACLIDEHILVPLTKILQPKHFYKEANQLMFRAILELFDKNSPVDIMLVAEILKKYNRLEDIGGMYHLVSMTNKISSSANTMHHAHVIIEKYMLREVIRMTGEYMHLAYDNEDPFELLTNMRVELDELDNYTNSIATQNTKSAIELAMDKLNRVVVAKAKTYYDTGWEQFDELVSISPNEILMIAGPAGHGKTKFIIALMLKLLSRHKNVAVDWYSFEDPMDKIIRAFIATQTGFTDKYLQGKTRKKITKEDLEIVERIKPLFYQYDIEFHEIPISAEDIRYSFSRFCEKRLGKLNICIIDNLLLVNDKFDGSKRDDRVLAEISIMRQKTKGLIIPVHHFSDEQQSADRARNAYRPRLKDMKGSEAYRRVPTQIMLVNKPGEYPDVSRLYPDRPEMKRLFITEMAKNRDGDTSSGADKGLIRWYANLDLNIFHEY